MLISTAPECISCNKANVCMYKGRYEDMLVKVNNITDTAEGQVIFPLKVSVKCTEYMENKPIARDIIQQQTPFVPVPLNPTYGTALPPGESLLKTRVVSHE